jgi:hypothetical protein
MNRLVKGFVIFGFVLFFILSPIPAFSFQLLTNSAGETVVYDDVNQNYWIWDMTLLSNKTYIEQQNAIATLNYFDREDWSFAGTKQMSEIVEQITQSGLSPFTLFRPNYISDSFVLLQGRFDAPYAYAVPGDPQGPIHQAYGGWSYPLQGIEYIYPLGGAGAGAYDDGAMFQLGAWGYAPGVLDNHPDTTPEPATMILLGLGLVGMAAMKKKFRK